MSAPASPSDFCDELAPTQLLPDVDPEAATQANFYDDGIDPEAQTQAYYGNFSSKFEFG